MPCIYFTGHKFLKNLGIDVGMSGSKLASKGDGKGLLMSYQKGLYSFHCKSKSSCYWTKEDFELRTNRRSHIMMTIPSFLVDGC